MRPDESADRKTFSKTVLDILNNVFRHADSSDEMGACLTEEIFKITEAQCVVLVECIKNAALTAHRVAGISPETMCDWAKSSDVDRLCNIAHGMSDAQCWRANDPSEAAEIIRQYGFELSVFFPLNVGTLRVGALLLLGLPDEKHAAYALDILNELSGIIAPSLRNVFLFERQEQIINTRTEELQTELAERKRAEKALLDSEKQVRHKLDAVLSPEADISTLELSDIIDSEKIQKLMDLFYGLTHIGIGIIDIHGKVLVGTGWQKICTDFHRVHPESCKLCIESDLELTRNVPIGTFKKYRCKNNMWDIATPIFVGGKHVGNIFLGQFLFDDEEPDYEQFRQQAKRFGFDEQEYLAALDKVPRWSHETVNTAMSFYSAFAEMISNLSYSNVKLANALEERKRAQDALRESEEKFRSLVQTAASVILYLSPDYRILEFNPEAERVFGRKRDEVIGENYLEIFVPETFRDTVAKDIKQVLTGEPTRGFENPIITQDGSERILLWNVNCMLDFRGLPTGVIAVGQDITDVKRIERALLQSEKRLEEIIDFIPDAIFAIDLEGRVTLWNRTAEKFTGYKAEDVLGKGDHEYAIPFYGERRPVLIDVVLGASEEMAMLYPSITSENGIVTGESYTRSVKRGEAYMLGIAAPLYDAEGNVVGAIESVRDITDRKLAELELRESEEKFRGLVEIANAYITIIQDGKFVYINPCAARTSGYTHDEMLALDNLLMIFHPDDHDAIRERITRLLAGQPVSKTIETRVLTKTGMLWMESSEVLIEYKGKPAVVATGFDITEKKKVEEALRDSERRLADIIDFLPDATLAVDRDKRIIAWNRAMEEMSGVPKENMLGKDHYFSMVPVYGEPRAFLMDLLEVDDEELKSKYTWLQKKGETLYAEVFAPALCNGKGAYIWVTASNIRDSEGNIAGAIESIRDITDRKLAEEELRVSLERYRLAEILSHVGSWDYNIQTTLFSGSDEAKLIYGFDPEQDEFTTEEVESCIPERERVHQALVDLIEENKPYNLEFEIHPKHSTETRIITSIAELQRDEHDNPLKIVGVIQDITERKRDEKERLANLRFFESLDHVNRAIQGTSDLEEMMKAVLDVALSIFDCDRAWLLYPCDPDAESYRVPMERTRPEYPGAFASGVDIPMTAESSELLRTLLATNAPVQNMVPTDVRERFSVQSQILMAIYPKTGKPWVFGLHQCSYPRVWTPEEERLISQICRQLTDAISTLLSQRDLRESEQMLKLVLDTIPVAVFWKDRNSVYMGCNSVDITNIGLSPEQRIGKTDYDFPWPKEEADRSRADDQQVTETGIAKLNYEEALHTPDGRITWVRTNKIPLRTADGEIIGVLGTCEDITERKMMEEALQVSEHRFRFLFEQTPLSMELHSLDGRLLYANPAWLKLWHSTPETLEYLKENWKILEDEQLKEKGLMPYIKKAFAGETVMLPNIKYEVNQASKQLGKKIAAKSKWIRSFVFPIKDNEGNTREIVVLQEDVTEQIKAEKEVKKLTKNLERRVIERTAQLEATNRELEAFTYSVSHDLRAPLRSIDGFSQAILEDYFDKLDVEGQDYLNRLRASAQRMGILIDDLLRLSRVTRAEMRWETVYLSSLTLELLAEFKKSEPERKVDVIVEPDVIAEGDLNLLRIAMENLLGNAWKFSGKEPMGTIEFGTILVDGEQTYFVRDNGVGFDMAYADKLFQPFGRLHSEAEFPGTGIGLAIVARIINRLGGRIWAEGEIDRGATFYFTLPGRRHKPE